MEDLIVMRAHARVQAALSGMEGEDRRPDRLRRMVGAGSPHYRFMSLLALLSGNGSALELGTCLATGSAHLSWGPGRSVWTVDNQGPCTEAARRVRREHRVPIYAVTSDTLKARSFAEDGAPFDILLIDARHDFESASQEFLMYSPMVSPGGIILCDDIHMNDGMRRFWDWLPEPKRELPDLHGEWGFGYVVKT